MLLTSRPLRELSCVDAGRHAQGWTECGGSGGAKDLTTRPRAAVAAGWWPRCKGHARHSEGLASNPVPLSAEVQQGVQS